MPIFFFAKMVGNIVMVSYLFKTGFQQVSEMLNGMVSVLMQGSQQLLQAFLNSVSVWWVFIQSFGVAVHGHFFLLVDHGDDSLLMHSLKQNNVHFI